MVFTGHKGLPHNEYNLRLIKRVALGFLLLFILLLIMYFSGHRQEYAPPEELVAHLPSPQPLPDDTPVVEEKQSPLEAFVEKVTRGDSCGEIDLTVQFPEEYDSYNCFCERLFRCEKVKGVMLMESGRMEYAILGIKNGKCSVSIQSPVDGSSLPFAGEMECSGEVIPSEPLLDEGCALALNVFAYGFLVAAGNSTDMRCTGALRDYLVGR